jgi:hypothetical protein
LTETFEWQNKTTGSISLPVISAPILVGGPPQCQSSIRNAAFSAFEFSPAAEGFFLLRLLVAREGHQVNENFFPPVFVIYEGSFVPGVDNLCSNLVYGFTTSNLSRVYEVEYWIYLNQDIYTFFLATQYSSPWRVLLEEAIEVNETSEMYEFPEANNCSSGNFSYFVSFPLSISNTFNYSIEIGFYPSPNQLSDYQMVASLLSGSEPLQSNSICGRNLFTTFGKPNETFLNWDLSLEAGEYTLIISGNDETHLGKYAFHVSQRLLFTIGYGDYFNLPNPYVEFPTSCQKGVPNYFLQHEFTAEYLTYFLDAGDGDFLGTLYLGTVDLSLNDPCNDAFIMTGEVGPNGPLFYDQFIIGEVYTFVVAPFLPYQTNRTYELLIYGWGFPTEESTEEEKSEEFPVVIVAVSLAVVLAVAMTVSIALLVYIRRRKIALEANDIPLRDFSDEPIQLENIKINSMIGKGKFGEVFVGECK